MDESLQQIKAVIMDAGDILFDARRMNERELSFVRDTIGITISEYVKKWRPFKKKAQTSSDYTKIDAFHDYLREINHPELISEYQEHVANFPKPHPTELVLPGVAETLAKLKEKSIDRIVITDTTRTVAKLTKDFYEPSGLAPYLTDIISSKNLGTKKPDPKIFEHTLKLHPYKKEEVIWIAHDLDEIKGGFDYGFRVIAFNYWQKQRQDGTLAPFVQEEDFIQTFPDLLKIRGLRQQYHLSD
jgi:FMN phosphatase YigB (HAD superfamily)